MSDDRPTVVVTDAGFPVGVTVCRSIAAAGARVVGVHGGPWPRWGRTRSVSQWHTLPDAEFHADEFVTALCSTIDRTGAELVVPTTEKAIHALVDHRRSVEARAPLALASTDALAVVRNKAATLSLADRAGIPTPQWALVETHASAVTAADELGYPAIFKPVYSHHPDVSGRISTRSVRRVEDRVGARRELDNPSLGGLPILVQRCVPGVGVGVEVLAVEGEIQHAFQHRRLHEVPLTGGMSSYREAQCPDPELLDYSRRLLRAVGWTGLAMVEFRIGEEGPFLMEINGRTWGSIALPVRAGLDFPALLATMHLDGLAPIRPQLEPGLRCRSLSLELRWLALAVRAQMGSGGAVSPGWPEIWRTITAFVDPRTDWDLQVLHDWRPGLHELVTAMGSLAGDVMGRVRR